MNRIAIERMFSRKSYNDLGFTSARSYFPTSYIKQLNDILDNLQHLPESEDVFRGENGKITQIQYLHNKHPVFQLTADGLLSHFARYLSRRDDLELLNVQVFEKYPRASNPTHPHQDNAYYMLDSPDAITFWIALDDIDEENGCLYYAPGTHKTPTRIHTRHSKYSRFRTRTGVKGLSLSLKEHPSSCDIPAIVGAGDIIAHNCNVIHRAGANISKNRRRRAVGVVYTPRNAKKSEYLLAQYGKALEEDLKLNENI